MAQQKRKEAPRSRENPEKSFTNTKTKQTTAKNSKQKELFAAINSSVIAFAKGPAGTGKSHIAISAAAAGLLSGQFERILVTRPMVPTHYEDVGALPGDLTDKFLMPYIGPIRPILDECLGVGHVQMFLSDGKITATPLAFMRGSTYNNTFMILDEAQNCVPEQIKMFLSRIGRDSKIVVTGDSKQSDISGVNGLDDAIKRLSWHPDVSVVEFGRGDIVRHSIISDILQSYEDEI